MFIHPSLRKGLGDEATPVLTEELRGVPRFRHVCGELGRHLSASDASARHLCGSRAPRAGSRQRQSVNREPFEGLRQCLTLSSKPDEQTAHLRSNQSRVPHLPVIAPTSLPRCRSTEREARLCPDNHPGETECSSARARRASPPRERSASTPKVAEPPTRHLPWAFEPQLTCMLPDMSPISRDDTPVPICDPSRSASWTRRVEMTHTRVAFSTVPKNSASDATRVRRGFDFKERRETASPRGSDAKAPSRSVTGHPDATHLYCRLRANADQRLSPAFPQSN